MAKRSLKITQSEVSMKLNLRDIFGKSVPDRSIRERIADEAKATIINRTLKGYGVDDGTPIKFVKYSKAYEKFKGQTNVDLELTGSMLNSILPLDLQDSNSLTVGIANKDAPKAHGHMTGMEGKGPLPKRPFLDMTESEIAKIQRKFQKEVDSIQRTTAKEAFGQKPQIGFTVEDIARALNELRGK